MSNIIRECKDTCDMKSTSVNVFSGHNIYRAVGDQCPRSSVVEVQYEAFPRRAHVSYVYRTTKCVLSKKS
jgi:hypothetical protein